MEDRVDVTTNGGTTPYAATANTINVVVASENDAPVLDDTDDIVLNTQAEDAGGPMGAVGTLISDLVSLDESTGNVTDVDNGAITGVAITGADTTNGTYFYTTDGGSTWITLGSVSDSSARVLDADNNTRIYFQSNADYNGTVQQAITFRAWDQTQGDNGTLQDASTNGGTSAFSSDTETAAITVTAVNDAPVITSDGGNATAAINVNETISAVTTVTVSDVDEPAQTITYSLGGIDANDFSIDTDGNLTFTSAPDFENPTDDGADNIYVVTVTASDGSLTDSQTITVTVVDVSATSLVVTTTADTDDTGLGATYTIEQLNAVGGGIRWLHQFAGSHHGSQRHHRCRRDHVQYFDQRCWLRRSRHDRWQRQRVLDDQHDVVAGYQRSRFDRRTYTGGICKFARD